jgi:photosystem II stability/assembly factor-like uncharacterized protein
MPEQLKQLYIEARTALKARDFDRASDLLRQILQVDENYKDASRLLARTVKLRRRRWYNHPLLWATMGLAVLVAIGVFLAPLIRGYYASQVILPTNSPTATVPPTATLRPTQTSTPTPTPIPLAWKRISVGQEFARDTITAIVVDPKDPDIFYVGTENAGIYKSIDGGMSWKPIQYGLEGGRIGGLAIDQNNPQLLYAAIVNGGIYKTIDGGQSWVRLWAEPDLVFYNTHRVAIAPWDGQILFQWGGEGHVGTYRSDDGGMTFYPISDECLSKGTLYISLSQPGTLFLRSLIDPYDSSAADCPGGIYRSTDRGVTWELLGLQGYYLVGGREEAFAVGGINDDFIYAIASTKPIQENTVALYATSDGGITWYIVQKGCTTLQVNPLDGKELYCFQWGNDYPEVSFDAGKTWKALKPTETSTFQKFSLFRSGNIVLLGGDGLFFSDDNGKTWQERSAGLGTRPLELKINPKGFMPLYLQEGICNTPKDRILYRSSDGGLRWEAVAFQGCDLAFDADGSTLYRGTARSTDGGLTWEQVYVPSPISLQGALSHPTQPGKVFVISAMGEPSYVFRSFDFGQTWEELMNAPGMGGTYPRLFYDAEGEVMYITASYYMYYSYDEGSTWMPCTHINTSLSDQVLAIDPRDNNHLYAATQGNGILVSTDGCRSWRSASSGLGSLFVNAIAMDPNYPDTMYAGTDGGAYVSFDNGQTWNEINDGLLGATVVYSIVVDMDSNVYAATPYGIFKLEGK